MKFSNRHNLPKPLFNALTWDTYTKGKANISVTELLKSPRQRLLVKRHDAEIEVDCSENLWSLMGRAVHHVLNLAARRSASVLSEERLYAKVAGPKGEWTVSGEFDLLEEVDGELILTDYKVLSVFSYIFEKENGGVKDDHEKQLNIYRWLLHRAGFDVKGLKVGMIFRDWKKTDLLRNAEEYPPAPIMTIPAAMWPLGEIEAFVMDRVRIHQEAEPLEDDALPSCSPADRWERPGALAVMLPGRKRAFKVFDEHEDAEAAQCAKTTGGKIEVRQGKSVKCEGYCYAAPHCNQFAAIKYREAVPA